jgi:hypothetical protein
MATVWINSEIKTQMRLLICNTYDRRIQQIRDSIDGQALAEEFYMYSTTEEYRKLAEKLNTDPSGPWIPLCKTLFINVHTPSKHGSLYIHVVLKQPIALPMREKNIGGTLDVYLPEKAPSYKLLQDILLEISDVGVEKETIINELITDGNSVLNKCRTVNRLLKIWPTAIEYLPNEVIEKLRT